MFVRTFFRLLPAIVFVDPYYCLCSRNQGQETGNGTDVRRESYIIEAHSYTTNSKSNGGSKEEPTGHLGEVKTAIQRT